MLKKRLSAAPAEIDIGRQYDYVVVNDAIDRAVEKLKAIIIAERCKVARSAELFDTFKI